MALILSMILFGSLTLILPHICLGLIYGRLLVSFFFVFMLLSSLVQTCKNTLIELQVLKKKTKPNSSLYQHNQQLHLH